MLPSLRLFTLRTAASIADRFRHRIAEWQLAGAMTVSGFILLRPGATFDLPPYVVVREIATEETWGTIFLLTGIARLIALAVNGSMPRGSSLVRAALAFLCAFFWVILLSGYMSMGIPTLMAGMLAGAFVTEFVNIYRAAGDTRTANNGNGNGGEDGQSG